MLKTDTGWEHMPIQSYYLVSEFRRILEPDRDRAHSLVQFYGKQLRRQWDPAKQRYPSTFDEVTKFENLHTVVVKHVVAVYNMDDDDHPFEEEDDELEDQPSTGIPELDLAVHIGLVSLR